MAKRVFESPELYRGDDGGEREMVVDEAKK